MFGLYGVGQEANRIGTQIMGQTRIELLGSAIHTVFVRLSVSVCASTSIPASVPVSLVVSVSVSVSCMCLCFNPEIKRHESDTCLTHITTIVYVCV